MMFNNISLDIILHRITILGAKYLWGIYVNKILEKRVECLTDYFFYTSGLFSINSR